MKKKLLKKLNAIGLFEKKRASPDVPAGINAYPDPQEEEKSEAHMHYLKSLFAEENDRLNLLESKTSQLIGQTGLIFSLLSLFVPLLVDKVEGLALYIKIVLLFVLLLSFGFYLLTIKNALRNYNVKNFQYSSPAPKNVQDFNNKTLNAFYSEVVRDLLLGLHVNNELNNQKAINLIQSYTTFRIANWTTGVLVVAFCTSLLFIRPNKPTITIEKPIKIEHFDTLIQKLDTIGKRLKTSSFKEKPTNVHRKLNQ
ncbi:hypothetical protein [Mucilaginibacter sp.]|uniref:hypothetical protein n=1 Tax=Mucilaginibacter sp. TaxID=1882438 RepID=UPI0026383BF2|nr:hypothetical protein [Mucilaginibacter sp.]MDB4926599.1 hypothetical protein [Mucilaginibacter sp.]